MAIALAASLCLASGYLVIALAWPHPGSNFSESLVKLFLSPPFGIGIFSIVFFVARILGVTRILLADLFVTAALLAAYLLLRTRARQTNSFAIASPDLGLPLWLHHVVTAAFTVSILAAVYTATVRALAHPHGEGWDAFAIWNLHARFLFLGGADHWRDGFNALLPWSHPDYPLLVPAATAHFWNYLGHNAPAIPAAIGLLFTFCTLGLLVSSLAFLRGRTFAMLAGLALASTPFFIEQGTSQYADVPLSFFFLASIVLLNLDHRFDIGTPHRQQLGALALSGLAAGFAAWTKNEGLLFLFAFLVAQIAAALQRRRQFAAAELHDHSPARLAALLLGLAPVLVITLYFKHAIAPAGDLFSNPALMAHKILSPARYWAILRWYAKEFLRFGNWWIIPGTIALLLLYVLSSGPRMRRRNPAVRSSLVTIGLTLAGYFAVYMITPYDIYWHLRFSLSRLFLQLWPTAIFLFFLLVAGQASAPSQNDPNFGQNHANC
jgi:hypothetical protein